MNLRDVLTAHEAMKKLSEKRIINYDKARKLAALCKSIISEFEFYAKEEGKLIYECTQHDEDGKPVILSAGKFKLKSKEALSKYEMEVKKLLDTEIEEITPITLCESDFGTLDNLPTPAEMLALESFVIFK